MNTQLDTATAETMGAEAHQEGIRRDPGCSTKFLNFLFREGWDRPRLTKESNAWLKGWNKLKSEQEAKQ